MAVSDEEFAALKAEVERLKSKRVEDLLRDTETITQTMGAVQLAQRANANLIMACNENIVDSRRRADERFDQLGARVDDAAATLGNELFEVKGRLDHLLGLLERNHPHGPVTEGDK